MWSTAAGDTWKLCGHFLLPTFEFSEFPEFLDATSFTVTSFSWLLQDSDSENSHDSWLLSVAASFPATSTINPPKYASFNLFWELDAASGFEFLLDPRVKFPCRCFEYPWFFRRNRMVHVDFATILSSSFCFCILFAIALKPRIKLKFWAQTKRTEMADVEQMKKIVFHSSRVKLPLVNTSANGCFVSMYLIWILGFRLILSNNQSKATLWVLD